MILLIGLNNKGQLVSHWTINPIMQTCNIRTCSVVKKIL